MRGENHSQLGQLLKAATEWRTAGAAVGVEIKEINTRFPDESPVTLRWVQEKEEVTDPETGVMSYPVVWEGWDVTTQDFS